MTHSDCPFCAKLARLPELADDEVVWQFPHSVVLLGPWQFYHGYCIVVARRHARELCDLDDAERRGYFDEMCLTAHAILNACKPHKINYELLGNQVPHLHWHLFPRCAADADVLRPVWFALDRAEHDPSAKQRLQQGPTSRLETVMALREAITALMA